MDIALEFGSSLFNDIISSVAKTIVSYYKDKKKDEKYVEIIKKLEEDKKSFEKELLSFAEIKISKSNIIFDEILSKYNLNLLMTTCETIFEKLNISNQIKIIIEEKIKNYKFSENLNHFNILILGRSGIGKSTLVNSILELDGTPEAAPTGVGKAVTEGEPKGYISNKKKGLRLWDSQGIDKEKYHISKVVESVKKLINIALRPNIKRQLEEYKAPRRGLALMMTTGTEYSVYIEQAMSLDVLTSTFKDAARIINQNWKKISA